MQFVDKQIAIPGGSIYMAKQLQNDDSTAALVAWATTAHGG
jgi:hypothetical protein